MPDFATEYANALDIGGPDDADEILMIDPF